MSNSLGKTTIILSNQPQPYGTLSNENSGNSTTQTDARTSSFNGRKVEKSDHVSLLLDDSHDNPLVTDSDTQQWLKVTELRDNITQCLEHTFDGSDKSFKRKLMLNGAIRLGGKTAGRNAAVVAVGTGVVFGCAVGSAGTVLLPVVAAAGMIALVAVATGSSAHIARLGGIRQSHKYFIHEKKWFKYFVDKDHMKLFLKEKPEKKDIKALEELVTNINDRLSDQFEETFESVNQALKRKKDPRCLKQELRFAPDILNIFLELAKNRYTARQTTNTEAPHEHENPGNSSNEILDTRLTYATEPESQNPKNGNTTWSFNPLTKTKGINNPAFIDDT
ncbi:hypothetical protein [Endozoicomonas sp.]|uniref:hypothetical protein n=1 Tax=Endozoicomonas sp. TaxID=1892382 RepID=UPI002885377B|nr:hypothetical protein [Endozoicomonas sp.]